MNKTIKKLDNNLCQALTRVCEQAKLDIPGFVWVTHTADYARFPSSLKITCVFETDADLCNAIVLQHDEQLIKTIQQTLLKAGVLLKRAKNQVVFDTEEAGAVQRLLK